MGEGVLLSYIKLNTFSLYMYFPKTLKTVNRNHLIRGTQHHLLMGYIWYTDTATIYFNKHQWPCCWLNYQAIWIWFPAG